MLLLLLLWPIHLQQLALTILSQHLLAMLMAGFLLLLLLLLLPPRVHVW
jgi:hypothetical protein